MENSKIRKDLLVLFILTVIPRVILFIAITLKNYPTGFWVYDSYGYAQIAYNLIENGVFSQSYEAPLEADYFRTPLYPLFLLLLQLAGSYDILPIFFQAFICGLTSVVIYKLCGLLFNNRKASLLAAGLYAIEPGSIVFSNLILSDTLHAFLFITSIYFFFKYLKTSQHKSLYIFSIGFALCILCRPVAVYLSFVFIALLIIHHKGVKRVVFTSTTLFLLTLSPWLIRNTIQFNAPFLSLIGDHILVNYHAASVMAEKENIPFTEAQDKMRKKVFYQYKGNARNEPLKYARFCREKSLAYIKQHYWIYAKQHAYGTFSILFKPVRGYLDAQLGWTKGYQTISAGEFPVNNKILKAFFAVSSPLAIVLVIIQVIVLACLYIGLIPGLLTLKKDNVIISITTLICITYFSLMVVPPFSEGRLRLPIFPLVAAIGAGGILKKYSANKSSVNSIE